MDECIKCGGQVWVNDIDIPWCKCPQATHVPQDAAEVPQHAKKGCSDDVMAELALMAWGISRIEEKLDVLHSSTVLLEKEVANVRKCIDGITFSSSIKMAPKNVGQPVHSKGGTGGVIS